MLGSENWPLGYSGCFPLKGLSGKSFIFFWGIRFGGGSGGDRRVLELVWVVFVTDLRNFDLGWSLGELDLVA